MQAVAEPKHDQIYTLIREMVKGLTATTNEHCQKEGNLRLKEFLGSPQHVRQAPIVPVESPWNLSSKSWVACSWKSSSITDFHTHGIFHTRSAHYGLAPRSTASSNKDSSKSKDSKSTTCSGCGGIYHSSPKGAISPKARKVRKYHLTMRLPHTWLQQWIP